LTSALKHPANIYPAPPTQFFGFELAVYLQLLRQDFNGGTFWKNEYFSAVAGQLIKLSDATKLPRRGFSESSGQFNLPMNLILQLLAIRNSQSNKKHYFQKMKESYPEDWPQFYTATIQGWKHLLKEEKFKKLIVDALQFLVESKKVKVNAFVSRWLSG